MDKETALQFKTHMGEAVSAMSSALVISQATSSGEEFEFIRRSVGDITARIDTLLCSVVSKYPELDDL
jgi:hypothetical protein